MKFEKKKHIHSGLSSEDWIEPGKLLEEISLKAGDTLLDVGCGYGYLSYTALEIVGKEGHVYAVDIFEEAVRTVKKEIRRRKAENIEAYLADVTKTLPIEDLRVDVCLMVDIMHGLVANEEVDRALEEIRRVMKGGGRLMVVDFKKIPDSPGPALEVRLEPERVVEIVNPFQFTLERTIVASPHHYGLIFLKRSV